MTLPLAQANQPLFRFEWIGDHFSEIYDRLLEHLTLVSLAIGLGLLISFALALVAIRYRRLRGVISGVTGILYTIPSLALFALLIPVTGLSVVTAEIGLVSYTLFILTAAILDAIDGVDPAVKEAADAMGYSRRKRLLAVELPLGLPVIFSGLRVAAVTVVGLVTVTALIGLGGFGFFILDGLTRPGFFWTTIVLGVAGSVGLAVTIDFGLILAQRMLTPWTRRRAPA